MPVSKKKVIEEIEVEPTPEPEPELVEQEILSEDEEIEIKKPTKRVVKKEESIKKPPKPPPGCIQPKKEKKERTQAQKDAWARCLEARQAKRTERAEVREGYTKELKKYKEELVNKAEKKVLKKAVAIKKKAAVMDKLLDEISDDETPIEVVKEKIKQRRAQKPKPEPDTRYQYMQQPELYVPTIRFI